MSCEPNAASVAKGLRTPHALTADNDRRSVIVLDDLTAKIGACLTVANSTDYKPVWTSNPPADFGTDLAQLQTNYGSVTVLAAQADAATGGGDASSATETALENA